jgi:hypothetical protein
MKILVVSVNIDVKGCLLNTICLMSLVVEIWYGAVSQIHLQTMCGILFTRQQL